MLERILERLFGSELCGQREKAEELKAAMGMKEKLPERKTYDDPDLQILADNYGELKSGMRITIELNEVARLLGRKRIRLDAFSGLIKKLHNEYGVELKIYSRRTKLEPKGVENEDLHGRNSD